MWDSNLEAVDDIGDIEVPHFLNFPAKGTDRPLK